MFTNYYVHCGVVWSDDWSSMSNDRCRGKCRHKDIEPFMSIDSEGKEVMHTINGFMPVNGWPDGINSLQELKEYALENFPA